MEKLYHYCSTDTFFKILNSKTIWMSDIFSMNDYLEFIWFFEIIKKHKESKFYDMVFRIIQEKLNNENFVFISCFSEESDLLSQWRGYSDDGKGFSIGFNKSILEQLGSLEKIQYCSLSSVPQTITDEINIDLSGEIGLARLSFEYNQLIEKYAPIVKNHKFSEESEWRIIEKIPKKSDLSNIEWRNSSDKVVPYIEKHFEKELISEIIIGPKNHTTIENMELFLKSVGFENVSVIKSEISYR